jgi:hypothetical protein
MKGSNVYKFARIDPKNIEIEYAYAHLDCTDKRAVSKKDYGGPTCQDQKEKKIR